MRSFLLTVLSLWATLAIAAPAIKPGFSYGSQKVRGVNLGGWLVLEPWITPGFFDATNDARVIDEYTYGQYVNRTKAAANLKKHWDTWITESDFSAIKNAGYALLPCS
jgi:glucan 1,3-beta-glucosidase